MKNNSILKRLLAGFVLLLTAATASSQNPHQLLTTIQKTKADTNRVRLLLQLGSYYFFKPGEEKNDLDSAMNYFNRARQLSANIHNDKLENEAIIMTGRCFNEANEPEKRDAAFKQVIGYYHSRKDKPGEAKAWGDLGDVQLDDNKNRISSYEQAHKLYTDVKDRVNTIDMLKNIADVHLQVKQFDLAEKELLSVLDQYKAIGYKKLYPVYEILGGLEETRANFSKSINYFMEGVKNIKLVNDTSRLPHFYTRLAWANNTAGKNQESYDWIRKAIAADRNPSLSIYTFYISKLIFLGKTQEALKELKKLENNGLAADIRNKIDLYKTFGSVYLKLKQYPQAEQYYLKLAGLDFNRFRNDQYAYTSYYIMCNEATAQFYIYSNQGAKAGKYLDNIERAVKEAKVPVHPIYISNLYKARYIYYSITGNYRLALKSFVKHRAIYDSLFTATKDKQVSELNIKYETEKKANAIKELKARENLQDAALQKAKLQRNITISGVIMLLIIAGLAYNGYRNKQRSNRALQTKQAEINKQNMMLQGLVTEKDWLLKEVHHRVKNNLQIIISLLNTQSAHLKNDAALAAIRESQNRVQAISLIHQRLYTTTNVASIDMPAYINELVSYLRNSFGAGKRNIRFEQMIDPVQMDLSQAIPAGLILNEAITNSIKYAFDGSGGQIIIALQLIGNDTALLNIADDGKGLPAGFDGKNASSLGMKMMKALSKQLGGTFRIGNKGGVAISIEFQVEKILRDRQTEKAYS